MSGSSLEGKAFLRSHKTRNSKDFYFRQICSTKPWSSDSGRSKLLSKCAGISLIKSKYIYTRRKVSVSSVERSPLVIANSADAEVTCGFNFPIQISIERKWKSASTTAGYFGTIRNFCKEQPLGHWCELVTHRMWLKQFLRTSCFFRKCQSSGIATWSLKPSTSGLVVK